MKKKLILACLMSTAAHAQLSGIDQLADNTIPNQTRGVAEQFCAGSLILNQVPNQTNGIFSDLDCDNCGSGVQVVADNFALTKPVSLTELVLYTGYFSTNVPLNPDVWSVNIHTDLQGLPDPNNIVFSEDDVASTRTDTGIDLFGVDEYRVVLTLDSPANLTAGTYWLEIHNNSVGSTENVFWEVGDEDLGNTIDGTVFATEFPGVTWNFEAGQNFALQICEDLIYRDGFETVPMPAEPAE